MAAIMNLLRRGSIIPLSAATVSFDTDLQGACVGLWVGVAGDMSVDMRGTGTAIVLKGIQAGTLIPGRFKQVNTTGTVTITAADVIQFYHE